MGLNLTKLIEETLQQGKQDLNLSHKNITDIPPEIRQLQDVVVRLGLSQNLLTRLPPDMTALYKLKYLNIRGNQFSQFPIVLCDMPNLEILDISRNKLQQLPKHFGQLMKLKAICLSKNRLKTLPAYLGHMSELRVLKIDGNPLVFPPKQIYEADEKVRHDEWLLKLQEYLRLAGDAPQLPDMGSPDTQQAQNQNIFYRSPSKQQDHVNRQLREQFETECSKYRDTIADLRSQIIALQKNTNTTKSPATAAILTAEGRHFESEIMKYFRTLRSDPHPVASSSFNRSFEFANSLLLSALGYYRAVRCLDSWMVDTVVQTHASKYLIQMELDMHALLNTLVQFNRQNTHLTEPLISQALALSGSVKMLIESVRLTARQLITSSDTRCTKAFILDWYNATLNLKESMELHPFMGSKTQFTTDEVSRLTPDSASYRNISDPHLTSPLISSQARSGSSLSLTANPPSSSLIQLAESTINTSMHAFSLLEKLKIEVAQASQKNPRAKQCLEELAEQQAVTEDSVKRLARTLKGYRKAPEDVQNIKSFHGDCSRFLADITKYGSVAKMLSREVQLSKPVLSSFQAMARSNKNFALQLRNPGTSNVTPQ